MEDITNKLADMQLNQRLDKEIRPKKVWALNDFEIGPEKGAGQFGKVYIARVKGMSLVYAMKVLDLKHLRKPDLLEKELIIHRELRHRHIVRLLTWFSEAEKVHLVLEWCNNGTVYDKMVRSGRKGFPEPLAAKFTAQLSEAVAYLHSRSPPILHRDIKPENAFLDLNDDIKLGDFGCSAYLLEPRNTVIGTHDYFAPELCNQESYGKALDAWGIGVFCYEMCFGSPPFQVPETAAKGELYKLIRNCVLSFPRGTRASPGAKGLITSLLQKHPEKRITVAEVLSHPWLHGSYYKPLGISPVC